MYSIVVRADYCKGCSICIDFCPKKILYLGEDKNSLGHRYVKVSDESLCIGCRLCEYYCPDFAIFIISKS